MPLAEQVKTGRTKSETPLKMSQVYEYPQLSKYEGLRGNLEVRAPTTYVGVEIELEKVRMKSDVPSSFHMTNDGSLKLDGKEFVTVPIRFCYLEQELTRLFGAMKTPHISSRCSIHVHLNARDFTQLELFNFILLYLIFEKNLFRFSGSRMNNIFCDPLYSWTEKVSTQINKLRKEGNIRYMEWHKYFALNLCPIWGQPEESGRIGTVEFRHMVGTTNVEHIIEWINLIVSLKISAKKFDTEDLISSLRSMNGTSSYNHLVREVFKQWSIHLTAQEYFKEDVEHGILVAKSVLPEYNKKSDFSVEIPLTDNKEVF